MTQKVMSPSPAPSQVTITLLGPTPSPTSQRHLLGSNPSTSQTLEGGHNDTEQLHNELYNALRPAVGVLKRYYCQDKLGGPPQPIETNPGPISVSHAFLRDGWHHML
jgi:hypothetical protein